MADIVLINPRFDVSYWGLEHALPFLGAKAILPTACLPLLAALTPPGHAVQLVDENVEAIDFDRCARADIVGITGMNVQRRRMREIIQELRKRRAFIVVGGPWVTVQEDYFGDLADVVFVGEAEETWPLFLAEWQQGTHQRRYEQSAPTDMSTVPVPRLDLLHCGAYAHGSIQFSRGCPFACEFCDIIVVFGRRPRLKTARQVTAELDAIRAQGLRTALVVDDNLVGNKKAIKELLRHVIQWQQEHGYPMTLVTEASLDLVEDAELMRMMVEANFTTVFVGIETPNEAALRETKKLQNLRKGGTMVEKVHRIQQAGLEVWSGMIVGFDHDDAGIFEAQSRFVQDARIINAMVNMLVAVPRTPLHERLRREGRLDPADLSPYGTNVIPRQISRAALRDGYVALMRALYEPGAYFDRVDALYLDAALRPGQARQRYLERHPWARRRGHLQLIAETLFIFVRLMWLVPQASLRREYQGRMWRFLKHRPEPVVLQIYAIKCAMHYHAHTMVQQMLASGSVINSF